MGPERAASARRCRPAVAPLDLAVRHVLVAPPTSVEARGKRIGVFVVAYDAEGHIDKTLARIPDTIWRAIEQVYIIDDCSTDETVERALTFESPWRDKIVVLRNRVNQRYGGNQKLGYQYAIDQGFDVVVMLHADGQYAPEWLPLLLDPILRDEAEVVIGSRMIRPGEALRGGMPWYKFAGNIVLTWIQNLLSGMRLSEFHSGYRAYSTTFLRSVPFWENSDEWHFDTQILFQASRRGARILEVEVPTYYGDEICHVNGIGYGVNCILAALGVFLYRHGILYRRYLDIDIEGRRYFEKFGDPASSHSVILRYLEKVGVRGRQVLELGVGDASLTRRLCEMGAVIDGIGIDHTSADLARPYCRNVLQNDLDDMERIPVQEQYDIIVAADVLEHLRDPEYVLSRLKRRIKVGGLLVVSLPNIANIYVRLNLLLGRFPVHRKGLLDRTHLHYYTLDSAARLMTRTGWVIEDRAVTAIPLGIVFPFLETRLFRWSLSIFRGVTRVLRGLLAYQGVFFCRNPNTAKLL